MRAWTTNKLLSYCNYCLIVGDACKVRDPRSGYEFDLSSLKDKDYEVKNGKYTYHLSVCAGLTQTDICSHANAVNKTVSSCQVDGVKMKIGGTKKLFCFYIIFCLYSACIKCICIYCLSVCISTCLHGCRIGKPASKLCGWPAYPELHWRRDLP